MPSLNRKAIQSLIHVALREDQARRDTTSHTVLPPSLRIRARVIAKSPGILAGGPLAVWTFQTLDRSLRCTRHIRDGASLKRGQAILTIEGRARSIFAAERTALNVLGHLSGIATLTHQYVQRVRGTHAVILDTRKTLPGLRQLEKYAVRIGGGQNHRGSLADAILIKTNHLNALRRGTSGKGQATRKEFIETTIHTAKKSGRSVEIEVTNFQEFLAALAVCPHTILLDNWSIPNIRRAVRHLSLVACHLPPALEVSGGVTLANVRAIAKTGINRISIGRLTHSAPSLDLSLRVL